ncbi:hypothetical protein LTR65_006812 [Meristemomyces frigidus]
MEVSLPVGNTRTLAVTRQCEEVHSNHPSPPSDSTPKAATAPEQNDRSPHSSPPDIINADVKTTANIVQYSSLLCIAPELRRNNIYNYVLVSQADIEIPDSGKLAQPGLLKTCQQITEEATAIYYAQNTFHACPENGTSATVAPGGINNPLRSEPAPTLLTIPPELRNEIYAYTLVSEAAIDIPASGKLPKPALLQTSRRVNNEATGIYYYQNRFRFCMDEHLDGLFCWLQQLPLDSVWNLHSVTIQYEAVEELQIIHQELAQAIIDADAPRVGMLVLVMQIVKERLALGWKKSLHALMATWVPLAVLHFDAPTDERLDTQTANMAATHTVEDVLKVLAEINTTSWGQTMEARREHEKQRGRKKQRRVL